MAESTPIEHELPGYGWTIKKLERWIENHLALSSSRSLLRRILKGGRLSWKKCRKVIKKADPEKRSAYIEVFGVLYEQMCTGQVRLVYVDEAHFHRDMDTGYTWALQGEPTYRLSGCAPLSDRINWYGAYDFSTGQCFIWNEGACNGEHTVQFLEILSSWLGASDRPTIIIWDGASWHRNKIVRQKAAELKLTV